VSAWPPRRQWLAEGTIRFVSTDATDATELCDEREGLEEGAVKKQQLAALQGAIAALPSRLQIVLSLYYVEDLTLKEIGQTLGVTESRICQLHSQAVARMRATLQDPA
jgi:RNA polymerase sigma factor for flagellar operon FliA